MQIIQDLRPTTFTLKEMDDELHSMALIRSLPEEYKSLSQSLMLLDDLNKTKIREAFLAEETNSQRRGGAERRRNVRFSLPQLKQHKAR